MDTTSIEMRYFEWLCDLVDCREEYKNLLWELHGIKFIYSINHDSNRVIDGMALRDQFAYEYQIVDYRELNKSCSVLEMMIGLSRRCEDEIMDVMDGVNRTYIWFWDMIKNAGLYEYDNDHFDAQMIDYIVQNILNRRYRYDGIGGFFPMKNPPEDLRDTQIWYQMMFWLQEKYPEIGSIF